MGKYLGCSSVPRYEDVPTLANFMTNLASEKMNFVTMGFENTTGTVVVAPGESQESVESQIMETIADGVSELKLLSDADFSTN